MRTGVIFDMDGLMVDTERIARIAWNEAARLHGREMSDEIFGAMIGRPDRASRALLEEKFGPAFDFEAAALDCGRIFEDYVARHGLPTKPGIREILTALSARKIPLGVATSTRHKVARQRLESLDLAKYFSQLVGGDEIPRGKPQPDIYLEAIRRLGIDATTSYALEDSYAGIRSAHAAGLRVIMVPDLLPPTPEIATLTVLIAPSLHDAQILLESQLLT
jgi:HAD superfamily hydrolase (TIGR01509 family)